MPSLCAASLCVIGNHSGGWWRESPAESSNQNVSGNRLSQNLKHAARRLPVRSGHNDDGYRAGVSVRDNVLLDIDSADVRQVEVEHNRIGNFVFQQTQSAQSVRGRQYGESLQTHRVLEHLARGAIVLNEQNGWARHRGKSEFRSNECAELGTELRHGVGHWSGSQTPVPNRPGMG